MPFAHETAHGLADADGGVDPEREDDERGEGETPFDGEHDAEGDDEGEEVGEEVREGAGDGLLDAVHIGTDAGEDFASAGGGEEADGDALEVIVEAGAEPVHDALADDLVGIGLIVPYIALIANPEIFTQSNFYPLFLSIGFSPNTDESLVALSYVLLTIFFLKTVSIFNFIFMSTAY